MTRNAAKKAIQRLSVMSEIDLEGQKFHRAISFKISFSFNSPAYHMYMYSSLYLAASLCCHCHVHLSVSSSNVVVRLLAIDSETFVV